VTVHSVSRFVEIPPLGLPGQLAGPANAAAPIVVFAHGSGSGRLSPRNVHVAQALNAAGFQTLLFDLLTSGESQSRDRVFDIPLLSERLNDAVEWLRSHPDTARSPLGLFGASTGAAAALNVAANRPDAIGAVVSRGGRPDLSETLSEVKAPTLLIVGGLDALVIEINRLALAELDCVKQLAIIPGATHLFEEPGTLDAVVDEARRWFASHLTHANG
jgi:putative phosphoribosyl transferase